MGDFNINLINYGFYNPTSEFLDGVCSNSFFPYVEIPTRRTPRSKALNNNIFHNNMNENAISGNLTTDVSDDLARFLIAPNLAKINM